MRWDLLFRNTAQAQDTEDQQQEQVEKWEQASATDQPDEDEEEAAAAELEAAGGPPDGPVDFTIKAEQLATAGTSPAEEANEMAAFLASAVRSAAQFQVMGEDGG